MTPGEGLGSRERALVGLSAALGAGGGPALVDVLDRVVATAAAGAVTGAEVEETLLQAYLFVGFPGVLEAFSAWRERAPGDLDAVATGDAGDADAPPDASRGVGALHEERGRRVCRAVYGPAYERLRSNVRRLHPDLDRWMIREGYGKVLGRPGLELPTRELCIVALLAAAGRGPQLHSHLRGALRTGAGVAATREALDAGLALLGNPAERERLEAVWQRVLRSARREGDG